MGLTIGRIGWIIGGKYVLNISNTSAILILFKTVADNTFFKACLNKDVL